jgi:hypothetical protein
MEMQVDLGGLGVAAEAFVWGWLLADRWLRSAQSLRATLGLGAGALGFLAMLAVLGGLAKLPIALGPLTFGFTLEAVWVGCLRRHVQPQASSGRASQ